MALPTRALADFMPMLLPNAPAVPWPVAEQALRLAAVEFCERTRCWRHITQRSIRRRSNTIVTPDFAAIFEIENATLNGFPLEPTQFSDIALGRDGDGGAARYITQTGPDSVTVLPFEEGDLTLSLFLKPRSGSDGVVLSGYDDDIEDRANVVPEFMFIQHAEAIVAGALSRVLKIPGQTYTNPPRGDEYMLLFERSVNNHFARNVRGQHRAAARSRPNYL